MVRRRVDKGNCAFGDCERIAISGQPGALCHTHYCQKRDGKLGTVKEYVKGGNGKSYYKYIKKSSECSFLECQTITSSEYCAKHQRQLDRHGSMWTKGAPRPICSVESCGVTCSSHTSKLCFRHHNDKRTKNCSLEFYLKLIAIDKCESCGKTGVRIVTDHDHAHDFTHTGNNVMCQSCIRGRLCDGCNRALGLLSDSAQNAENLSKYITDRSKSF